MATTRQFTATDIGERVADAIQHLSFIRGVWTHAVSGRIETWIVTDNVSYDDELGLYSLPLHDWFPEARVRVVVVNPQNYEPDTDLIREVVPSSAIAVRRSRAA